MNTKQTAHTPTPRLVGVETLRDWLVNGGHIAGRKATERAEYIFRACNAHDDLVAALEMARTVLEGAIHPSCRKPGDSLDKISSALAKAGAA